MGCWNQTCAITNLPILDGDEVYVFILQKTKSNDPSVCYPTAYWQPSPFFFEGKYNDHGEADECHGVLLEPIIRRFKQVLFEFEVGENEYHDIAVKADELDVELLFDANHEDRLYVRKNSILRYPEDRAKVRLVMIRKGALDAILTDRTVQKYVGGEEYKTYTFADLVADVKAEIALARQSDNENIRSFGLNGIGGGDWSRCIRAAEGYGAIFHVSDALRVALADNNEELLEAIIHQVCVVFWVNEFMMDVRMSWLPPTGAGSQESETKPYRTLISIMEKEMKEIESRWDDEEWEEGDE